MTHYTGYDTFQNMKTESRTETPQENADWSNTWGLIRIFDDTYHTTGTPEHALNLEPKSPSQADYSIRVILRLVHIDLK